MQDHRLAAIMFTDIVGYTALMGKDEDRAFELLHINKEIHTRLIKKHHGTLIKEIGDGMLASFNSSSDTVRCAFDIQSESKENEIPLKIGIHEGEMVFEGDDVHGDGVNIASRLEAVTETGNITISEAIYRNVKNKPGIYTAFLEEKLFKNVDDPVKIYRVSDQEITLDDKKPEKVSKLSGKKGTYALVAFGVILVIAIVLWKFYPLNQPDVKTLTASIDKSIAVLPFKNDSPDPDNKYFCNGMMEDILTNLQNIGELNVKSRTDVEQYRETTKTIADIGIELGVAFILEGSVRKMGDNLRINAQLIDVNTGNHLWADNYNGKYTAEIFEFQSSIAKKVAASLMAVITPQEEERIDEIPTSEIAAYDLCLRGWEQIRKWQMDYKDSINLTLALNLFNQALEVDPEFNDALHGKGTVYLEGSNYDSANYYFEKEIELYPDHPAGYSGKGRLFWVHQHQADSAYKYYSKAVELGPNDLWTNFGLGQICIYMRNEVIRGLTYFQKAYESGGESTGAVNFHLAFVYMQIGDYPRAEKYYKKAFNLSQSCRFIPRLTSIFKIQGKNDEALHFLDSICSISDCGQICDINRFRVYLNKREFNHAEQYYNKAVEEGYNLPHSDSVNIAYLYKETGREKEATTILERFIEELEISLEDSAATHWLPVINRLYATAYVIMDENEKALKYISAFEKLEFTEKKFDNWSWLDDIQLNPLFENLRNDPEFKAIVKRAQEQKAALRAELKEMGERGEIDL